MTVVRRGGAIGGISEIYREGVGVVGAISRVTFIDRRGIRGGRGGIGYTVILF